MTKTALITGITGQDGSYLAEHLLSLDYIVHGIRRRSSSFNSKRIDHLYQDPRGSIPPRMFLHYGDLTDASSLIRIIQSVQPDEIYNLGAQSHVQVSFEAPEYTANADGLGTLRILEAIRILNMSEHTKFYQASTSEIFGGGSTSLYNESSMMHPRSPYGAAKLYAHWITTNYREAYGFFAVNGILFNHESPRRGETFVTKKIAAALTKIKLGIQDILFIGNLEAKRDWGHAKDYVRAMRLMLQQESPADFVIATGQSYSVREFVEMVCKELDMDLAWKGSGLREQGVDVRTGKTIVKIDPTHFRPSEVDCLKGDATKARQILGWEPTIHISELVSEMVNWELREVKNQSRNIS